MAVSVKRIQLWRREVDNRAGTLAETLEPLARTRANLKVVMGYDYPGNPNRAAIEVFPVTGARSAAAARQGGLEAATIPTLLVEGDNRPALGYTIARAVADAGINLNFLIAQVVGNRYSAVFGFSSDSDANRAAAVIKRAAAVSKRRPAAKRRKKAKRR